MNTRNLSCSGLTLLGAAVFGVCSLANAVTVPELSFSSFLGGDGREYNLDQSLGVAVDAAGSPYLVGTTTSPGFPVTQVLGPLPYQEFTFVTKVHPTGSRIIYSTALTRGYGRAIAVDGEGNAYIVGYTAAGDFPVAAAEQPEFGGAYDAFVAKLSPDGAQLLYATYLGGSDLELGTDIAVDDAGNAYVCGWTTSTNFPATSNAAQRVIGGNYDAFVAKFSPEGRLLFATYVGGPRFESGASLALDAAGRVYMTGTTTSAGFPAAAQPQWLGLAQARREGKNAYVARLSPDGSALEYLAYVGGSGEDLGAAVALDRAGSVYLLGETWSADLPTTANSLQPAKRGEETESDAFVVKLEPSGAALAYATYLGGSYSEDLKDLVYAGGYYLGDYYVEGTYLHPERGGLAVDSAGNVYVGGTTGSFDLEPPGTPSIAKGNLDGYVAKLNADGSQFVWFRYLGSGYLDWFSSLALVGDTNVLVTGGIGFPFREPYYSVTPGVFQEVHGANAGTAFVARLREPLPTPANDAFATRIPLQGKLLAVEGLSLAATREPDEPLHAGSSGGRSLWWSWQAPADGRLILSTAGSTFDTVLAVYTGAALAALEVAASNDNFSAEQLFSRVIVPVQAGATYQIAVDGHANQGGGVVLSLSFSRPANDDFAQRQTVSGLPATATGTNVDATREPDEPAVSPYARSSVWWSWTSPVSGDIAINTFGSEFNTMLAVYTNDVWGLSWVAWNDDHPGLTNHTSQVTFPALAGTTYHVQVDGSYLATGQIQLNILPATVPPNDNFAEAIRLTGTSTNFTASNVSATREPGEPDLIYTNVWGPYSNSGRQTLWWKWTSPADGFLRVSTAGSEFDTRLAVFTGSTLAELKVEAQNDDVAPGLTSMVVLPVRANTTYYIQVDGAGYNPQGTIHLALRFTTPPVVALWSVRLQPDGSLCFQVAGTAGQSYAVQASTNLRSWEQLPGAGLIGETFSYTDTNAFQFPRRYYRIVEAP